MKIPVYSKLVRYSSYIHTSIHIHTYIYILAHSHARAANRSFGAGGQRAAAQLERTRRHSVGHVARHHTLRSEALSDPHRVAAQRTHHSIQVSTAVICSVLNPLQISIFDFDQNSMTLSHRSFCIRGKTLRMQLLAYQSGKCCFSVDRSPPLCQCCPESGCPDFRACSGLERFSVRLCRRSRRPPPPARYSQPFSSYFRSVFFRLSLLLFGVLRGPNVLYAL